MLSQWLLLSAGETHTHAERREDQWDRRGKGNMSGAALWRDEAEKTVNVHIEEGLKQLSIYPSIVYLLSYVPLKIKYGKGGKKERNFHIYNNFLLSPVTQ